MITPDAAVERNALSFNGSRNSDFSWAGMSGPSVEPAVRTPFQAIGKIVIIVASNRKPIQHHLRGPVGLVVAIGIRNKEQLRRTHQPDTRVADLDAGQHLNMIGKYLPTLSSAITIFVFEDYH